MDEMDDVVVLTDENGQQREFSIVDVIEVDGREYAILVPTDEQESDEDADEAVILRIDHDEDDNEVLVDIEDDEEWEHVAEAWEKMLDEEEEEDLDDDWEEEEDEDSDEDDED